MKKIANISIIIWLLMIVVLCGSVWVAYSLKGNDTKAEQDECLKAAKVVIELERSYAYDDGMAAIWKAKREVQRRDGAPASEIWHADEELEHYTGNATLLRDKLKKPQRSYAKLLVRLKERESILHTHSKAIEKWMVDGRAMFKDYPRTEADLEKFASKNSKQQDEQWEIYMEKDMQDLLKQ